MSRPIKVYGKDEDLKLIRQYAINNHLPVSVFLRKLALSEINRHPKSAPLRDMIRDMIKEELAKGENHD